MTSGPGGIEGTSVGLGAISHRSGGPQPSEAASARLLCTWSTDEAVGAGYWLHPRPRRTSDSGTRTRGGTTLHRPASGPARRCSVRSRHRLEGPDASPPARRQDPHGSGQGSSLSSGRSERRLRESILGRSPRPSPHRKTDRVGSAEGSAACRDALHVPSGPGASRRRDPG